MTQPRSDPPSHKNGVVLFLVACFIYSLGRAPFFGQWDSFDYLRQIVTHQLSDLAFGRPVFIGYNIFLWEIFRRIFGLVPVQVEQVVMAGIILTGGLGVLLFRRFARDLLPPRPSRMATLAFLLSPMYAVYSGFVMTEVPMLVVILAAGVVLWESNERFPNLGPLAGGILFGLACGIREQAATLGAACLWILWERRRDLPSRLRACLIFAGSTVAAALAPIAALYFRDPAAFIARTQLWLRAIPTGGGHLVGNVESSLVFAMAVCPGVWLALAGGYAVHALRRAARRFRPATPSSTDDGGRTALDAGFSHPAWGVVCGFVLPLAVLWRDADVQMHPRYLLILLPAALLWGASLFDRLFFSTRAAVWWAIMQTVVFGAGAVVLEPVHRVQYEKRDYANLLLKTVPGTGLLVSGGLSPALEYYRDIGTRPNWEILWSGWGWNREGVACRIRKAWAVHVPVYLCDAPWGWLMLEDERLDLYYVLMDCPRVTVAPGITRYYPPKHGS